MKRYKYIPLVNFTSVNFTLVKFSLVLFTLVTFTFSGIFPLNAQDYKDKFSRANNFYVEQQYTPAAELYEDILKNNIVSGELYFNLGNAYFKMQKYGLAILNYERALKFIPADEELRANLELANSIIADKIISMPDVFYIRYFNWIRGSFSQNTWMIFLFLSFILTNITFSARVFIQVHIVKRILKRALVISSSLVLISGIFFYSSYRETNRNDQAIVIVEKTAVFSSPSEDSQNVFDIHEGTKTKIERQSDGWFEIKLTDGKVGWITQEAVVII